MMYDRNHTRMKSIICFSFAILTALFLGACSKASPNVGKGMRAIEELDYQAALDCFEQAETEHEDARQIYRGMGIAYMGLADYGHAVESFEETLKLSRGLVQSMDYDINYYLAAAYTKCSRLNDAEVTYDAILALKPDEVEAYFLRGNVRLGLNKAEKAKEDFDQVVQMEPRNYERLIQIFQVLDNYGYRETGQAYLQAALDQGSNMSAFDKGRIYFYLEQYQNAYMALEEARSTGSAEAYLYLGRAYEATGDYNYAANVYNSYLAQKTDSAEIYNQLGLCELQRGEYQNALNAFQAGMKVENNEIMQSLSFNEIAAYEYLGEFTRAKVLMETYLQNYPDDANAQRENMFLSTR